MQNLVRPQGLERRAPRSAPSPAPLNLAVISLTLLAATYNALLAIVNGHVMRVNFSVAAAIEIVILTTGIILAVRAGINKSEKNVLYFFAIFVTITLTMSLFNQQLFVDGLRNMMIVTVFFCLGRQANLETIKKVFLIATVLVLACLILELSALDQYAALLKPAQYFANTRGIAEFEYDDTGLFRNAMGFEGRFSYGLFSGPRTSSLFLEQVSLANYAAVLCIFLLALWPKLTFRARVLHAATVVLIVVSNNTRTTSMLVVLSLVGYFLYPRLPRYLNSLTAPLLLGLGVVMYHLYPNVHGDDFVGRVSLTGRLLTHMEISDYLGMGLDKLSKLWDSGYPYLITSTSIVGLFTYWLFVSFVIPQKTPAQIRCAYATTLYIFMNMLVSGNATYSMKVAALLWLLVGFVSSRHGQQLTPVVAKTSSIQNIFVARQQTPGR